MAGLFGHKALIAGVVSSTGAAHEVLRLAEAGLIELVISRQVLIGPIAISPQNCLPSSPTMSAY